MKNKNVRNKIISAIVMCIIGLLLISIAKNSSDNTDKNKNDNDNGKIESLKDDVITVWYVYSGYEKYINSAIESYKNEKQCDFAYEVKYISNPGFFDYINEKTLEGNGPDLFVLGSEYLEKAYLLGLLDENTSDVYNEEVYASAAILASKYNDKMYAYPLGFDVAMLSSNNKYVTDEIKTFEDIKAFADNFNNISDDENNPNGENNSLENSDKDSSSSENIGSITGILSWDINKLLFNYGFVGKNISFNDGKNKKININNTSTKEAITKYLLLKDYFSLSGEEDYSTIKKDFLDGKLPFSIVGIDILSSGTTTEYKLQKLPDLTESIKCNSLSYTDLLAVNPRSKNIAFARDLAKYITYDYAKNMFDIISVVSCRKDIKYENENINQCLDVYDESIIMPNILETEDYCIVMEEALKAIWNGNSVDETLAGLQKKYSDRIK